MKTTQSARELESLIENPDKNTEFWFPVREAFRQMVSIATDVRVAFPRAKVVGILDIIRNRILEWSLDLEQRGILGEDMSFSADEKSKASSVPSVTNTFHGPATFTGVNMGHMSDEAKIDGSTQIKGDFAETIRKATDEVKKSLPCIPENEREEVSAQLAAIDEELTLPSPRPNRIKSSFQAILRIAKPIAEWAGKTAMESAVQDAVKQMLPPG